MTLAVADVRAWQGPRDGVDGFLDLDERRRAAAFVDPAAATRYTLGHALLRSIVGAALERPQAGIRFDHDRTGRPRRLDPGGADLSWSLSHAGDLVVVAIAHGFDFGVDVETIDPRRADLAMAQRYLPPTGIEAIMALPPGDRPGAIARAWTRLEAEAKGRGCTLDDLRGRERTGVHHELAVAAGHVSTLWTAGRATVICADRPLLASVA